MVQNRDLKDEFAGNFVKQQRWLNNLTLNSVTLRIWEEFQKEEKKKKFRTARLLKISFGEFNFEWLHVPKIQISLTT